jgi:polyphosphate kinase
LATPVTDPKLQQRLIDILHDALNDNRSAWELDCDGFYRLRMPAPGEEVREFQAIMMKKALQRSLGK